MTVPKPEAGHAPGVQLDVIDNPWLGLQSRHGFFQNAEITDIMARALSYVRAGVCVHFSGMAGLGKTTMALRIAEALGRPVSFMTGNEWLTTKDFIGGQIGETTSTVVDKYVQSVRRSETTTRADWKDSILAVSMERGYTLVYDEFTRASPAANAALLSVLEEGVLVSTDHTSTRTYIEAHPDFRIILTSNPHDYQGVNMAPDALVDRMVTLRLKEPSAETLAGIVAARSGLDPENSRRIVHLVLRARESFDVHGLSSMRTSILIARLAAPLEMAGQLTAAALAQIASDVLSGRGAEIGPQDIEHALDPQTAQQMQRIVGA
ncbi:ATPase associated with various cellular activity [Rhodovulum sp. P5]|uniref:AAA family ATPase n=1 Tax=Rhodovulum sp. P5 TaxID=1564506 RepID=UPI0009C22459|nr:AAA family ATPase [Rhodovulum sp. P5]ARE42199.1 ATPase associated with various cellular activity [Rhodovulum sp. P5]